MTKMQGIYKLQRILHKHCNSLFDLFCHILFPTNLCKVRIEWGGKLVQRLAPFLTLFCCFGLLVLHRSYFLTSNHDKKQNIWNYFNLFSVSHIALKYQQELGQILTLKIFLCQYLPSPFTVLSRGYVFYLEQ